MPLIIAEIEEENPVVSTQEKTKLLDFVFEEETDISGLVDDIREDNFDDVLKERLDNKERDEKREQDGITTESTLTPVSSSAESPTELKKEDPKDKASKSPETAPETVDNSGAQTKDAVKAIQAAATPVSTGMRVTSYLEQGKIGDNSYWAYRSVPPGVKQTSKEKEKDTSVQSIKGFVKYKFSANWNTLTEGIPVKSVWDVIIAMNVPQVGLFNKKIQYVAEENTEQHMMILNDSMVFDRGKGTTIGLYGNNPSWADEPYWCGAWTDFLTNRAGLSRRGGSTVGVDSYHRSLSNKGLVNAPTTGIKNNAGKIKFQDSWLPSAPEGFNPNGVGAIFVNGYHFQEKGDLTDKGKALLKYLLGLGWGMATISVGTSTHVETCVTIDAKGSIITIGGNTSGGNDRNGTQIAVKTKSISGFCGKKEYVVFGKIEGNVNRSTNRLNAKYNMTETMKKYMSDAADSSKKNISKDLSKLLKQIT